MQSSDGLAGGWKAIGGGGLMSAWGWLTAGMNPLTALLTALTVVYTVIKIAQEVRAWRNKTEERTAIQKLLDRLGRRSTFDKLNSKPPEQL